MTDRSFFPRVPEKIKSKDVFVRKEFFLQIESGFKTCELRIAYDSFLRIKPGQILEFKTSGDPRSLQAQVVALRQYPTLESMMGKEDINKIAPGISSGQAQQIFKQFFKEKDVKDWGLVVIEFKKIKIVDF